MEYPRCHVKIIGGKLHRIPIKNSNEASRCPVAGTTSRNAYTWPLKNSRNRQRSYNSTLQPLQEKKALDVFATRETTHEISLRIADALKNHSSKRLEKALKMFEQLDRDHSGRITQKELRDVLIINEIFILGKTWDDLVNIFELQDGIHYKPLRIFLRECFDMKAEADQAQLRGVAGLGLHKVNQVDNNAMFRDREEAKLLIALEKELFNVGVDQLDDLKDILESDDSEIIGRKMMVRLCKHHIKLPISDNTLDLLLDRCCSDIDGCISCKEFLRYLERARPINDQRLETTASSVPLREMRDPLPDVARNTKKLNSRQSGQDVIHGKPRMVSGQTQTESGRTTKISDGRKSHADYLKLPGPQPEVLNVHGQKVNVFAPDEFVDIHPCPDPPGVTPILEWVHGYRGKDCRNNLFALPSDEVVYFIAGVVVIYDPDNHKQRHYCEHKGEIRSLAVHPGGCIVASGQAGSKKRGKELAQIRVWEPSTLKTICVLGSGFFEKAVVAMDFSKKAGFDKGKYLVAVDDGNPHIISLWDWKNKKKLSNIKIHVDQIQMEQILGVLFSPYENEFLTYGKQHFSFWFIDDDKKMRATRGRFEQKNRPKSINCATFTNDGVVTGDSNGNLIAWPENRGAVSKTVRNAHEGPVFALLTLWNGFILSAGGTDGRIRAWDRDMHSLVVELKLPSSVIGVRSLAVDIGNTLYIGTTNHCLYKTSMHPVTSNSSPLIEAYVHLKPLIQGHYECASAIAAHPKLRQFVTGGYDDSIQLWDADDYKMLWSTTIPSHLVSACFHPNGNVVVAGCNDGSWHLLNASSGEVLRRKRSGKNKIIAVQFSPAGLHLAVASEDKNIYIYRYQSDAKDLEYVGKLQSHHNTVNNLDWAEEGEKLQSASENELLYWDAVKCEQIKSPEIMRNTAWKTFTCKLGYPVIGIHDQKSEATNVCCAATSGQKQLVAVGDNLGQVKLFTYPCNHANAKCKKGTGHSDKVLGMSWLHDDSRLITLGGKDKSIMQWKIAKDD